MDNRTSGCIIKTGNTVLNFDTNPILNMIKKYDDIYRIYKGLSSVGIAYFPDATNIDSDLMLSKLYELKQYTDNMSETIHDAIQVEIGSR